MDIFDRADEIVKAINNARTNENHHLLVELKTALAEVNAELRAQGYAPVVVSEEG